jgi:hypothetical protein
MMKQDFDCDDSYEAEKLAGLLSLNADNSSYIYEVATVINNEIVVTLKDRSSHSIIMRDHNTALNLSSFLQDILDGKKGVLKCGFGGYTVNIILNE